jgi:hypothetical protein
MVVDDDAQSAQSLRCFGSSRQKSLLRKYAPVRGFVTVLNFGQYRLSSYVGTPLLRDTGWPRLSFEILPGDPFHRVFMNGKSRHVPRSHEKSQNYIWMFVFRTFAKSGKAGVA